MAGIWPSSVTPCRSMASRLLTASKISSVTAVGAGEQRREEYLRLPAHVRRREIAQHPLARSKAERRAQTEILAGDGAVREQRGLGRPGGPGGEDHLRAIMLGHARFERFGMHARQQVE
jgi:hypothetical protein